MGRMSTDVHDDRERSRYQATVDGAPAGVAVYRRDGSHITFLHTEVDDAFEGQGVGSVLVRRALDDARAQGLQVRVECPFMQSYVERHPQYQDLLASG
jgi:uncharacterized protein